MTNVFLSWSGDISKEIAEELRAWIPSVLQFAKPYFTPNDVEKGSKWSSEISTKLAESHVGIFCLTKDNFSKPWILFEAGALSKDIDRSRVCSVLFGMDNADLTGPLTNFQTTAFEKSDFRKLMLTINDAGGDRALQRETFDSVFSMWWPKLEEKIQKIVEKDRSSPEKETRSEHDILQEILALSRLTARRSTKQSTRNHIPAEVIDHLMSTVSESIHIYERDEEKAMYDVLRNQLEICNLMIETSLEHEERFRKKWRTMNDQFDDIIPF